MKKIYFVLTLVTTISAMQPQKNLALNMMHLQRQLQALERELKKSRQQAVLQIFAKLENFSKLLDGFFKLPSVANLDKVAEKVLHEITFEGIEQLDIAHLKKLRESLNAIDEKIFQINQCLVKRGVAPNIREEFIEIVVDTFKREKALIDGYIAQRILEFQRTLFSQALKNVRNNLIQVQKDPTVETISHLENSIRFNIRYLDVIDCLKTVSGIFLEFTQLVKDIEDTFLHQNSPLQNFAKKTGRASWLTQTIRRMFDSLHATQQEFRSYVKMRLEKSRAEQV